MLTSCSPIPGASERISNLYNRYKSLKGSIAHYEARAQEQAEMLGKLKSRNFDIDDFDVADEAKEPTEELTFTTEDLEQEEHDIKELERKKRGLEDRVTAMEKDISGLT
jgi:chromosome segregation ATPase